MACAAAADCLIGTPVLTHHTLLPTHGYPLIAFCAQEVKEAVQQHQAAARALDKLRNTLAQARPDAVLALSHAEAVALRRPCLGWAPDIPTHQRPPAAPLPNPARSASARRKRRSATLTWPRWRRSACWRSRSPGTWRWVLGRVGGCWGGVGAGAGGCRGGGPGGLVEFWPRGWAGWVGRMEAHDPAPARGVAAPGRPTAACGWGLTARPPACPSAGPTPHAPPCSLAGLARWRRRRRPPGARARRPRPSSARATCASAA